MLFVKFTVNCYSTVEAPARLKMYLLFPKWLYFLANVAANQ